MPIDAGNTAWLLMSTAVGGALVMGLVVGGLSYGATVLLRERLRVDDALDVFAVHGVGGMWGAVATGIFAVAAIGGVGGLIEGDPSQVVTQLVAVVATIAFAGAGTFVIIKAVDRSWACAWSRSTRRSGSTSRSMGRPPTSSRARPARARPLPPPPRSTRCPTPTGCRVGRFRGRAGPCGRSDLADEPQLQHELGSGRHARLHPQVATHGARQVARREQADARAAG